MAVALGLTIGAAVAAWKIHRATAELRADAQRVARERLRFAAEAKEQERRLAEKARRQAELEEELNRRPSGVAFKPAAVPPVPLSMENPERQAHALRTFKAGLTLKYAAFYRAQGFDAERIAKFEALPAEHEGRKLDLRAAERGLKPNPAAAVPVEANSVEGKRVQVLRDGAIATLQREEDERFKAAQSAWLGEAGFQQLRAYENTAESRTLVGELAANLSLMAEPLSAKQAEQLSAALDAGNLSVRIEPESTRWTVILDRAQTFLTPAQLGELQALAGKYQLRVGRNDLARLIENSRQ